MTLVAAGPLYLGLKSESFWDIWVERDTLCVHLGIVALEFEWSPRSNGPTQKPTH